MPSRQVTSNESIASRTRSHSNRVVRTPQAPARSEDRRRRTRLQRPVEIAGATENNNRLRRRSNRQNNTDTWNNRRNQTQHRGQTADDFNVFHERLTALVSFFMTRVRERAPGNSTEVQRRSENITEENVNPFHCGYCNNRYFDRQPVVTKCGHIYCDVCVYVVLEAHPERKFKNKKTIL